MDPVKSILGPNILNTVEAALRLPLMLSEKDAVTFRVGLGLHKIFVPSNLGGRLTIGLRSPTPDDKVAVLTPEGAGHSHEGKGTVRIDVEVLRRGAGVFLIAVHSPRGRYSIFALWDEIGSARTSDGRHLIPWNFWYFPFARSKKEQSAWGSTIFRPLDKYEDAFGQAGVVELEKQHHNDPAGTLEPWEGHCDFAAPASLVFEPPPDDGVEFNGVQFTCEEIKLLATEIFGRFGVTREVWTLDEANPEDGELPRLKPTEDPQRFGKEALVDFLEQLRREIRERGRALVMDLRDATGNDRREVWNHVVFHYRTRYWQADLDDPTLLQGFTRLFANADTCNEDDGASTGMPAEVITKNGERQLSFRGHVFEKRELHYQVRFSKKGFPVRDATDNQWSLVLANGAITFAPRMAAIVEGIGSKPRENPKGNPLVRAARVSLLIRLRPEFPQL